MFALGGTEILLICAIIGGVIGYFRRVKNRKNGALIGIILGMVGAVVVNILLITFVFQSYFAIPVYAILGAWLFTYIWSRFQKEEEPVS
ncbi:hypothetical protein [Chitinophaga filiformis]|uniref:Transglycosylase associated protein n=1 Tax=Chitinophaga filiformis TaxID=104663 RepID=A0ABY4HSE4_CHIFI|nr:hypothetical protein [Chitinophaga filiformis]UPK66680.1 hypothetical protein MYF79_17225 [Chitinophaga filiformis]